MNKFVRVMDDTKSNAGGFEYKLDEVNISNNWNPNEFDPEKMGGFNFSSEYDVIIPEEFIIEFENYTKQSEHFNYDDLGKDSKTIYDMLKKIK